MSVDDREAFVPGTKLPARFPFLEELGVAQPLLTDDERETLRLTGELANRIATHVAPGPAATQDIAELYHHLHVIQRYIGGQAAARAYPEEFRLLGSAGAWNEATA